MPKSIIVRKFTTVFFAGLLLAACNPGSRPLADVAPGGWSAGIPASHITSYNVCYTKLLRRFHTRFATLDEKQQREILGHQLPEQIPADMPYAGSATHVAIGLLAWFYATSEANDLAHEAKIGRETCRGLASGAEKPAPLES